MTAIRSLAFAALVLLAAAAPALAPSATADPVPTRVTLDLPLEGATWVAWRFNLTPGSDLSIGYHYQGCDPVDAIGEVHAFIRLHNGGEAVTHSLRGSGPGLWSPALDVGVEGEIMRVRPDLSEAGLRDGQCSANYWGGAGAMPGDHTLTVVMLSSAPTAEYNLSAVWTTGVLSWDVATGPGVAKTTSEFEDGASAAVWGTAAVGTVGALLHDAEETQDVAFGWFLPADVFGPNVYACKRNGAACAPPFDDYGSHWLTSAGPTRWDFDIQFKAQATQQPTRVLGLYDLPREYAPEWTG